MKHSVLPIVIADGGKGEAHHWPEKRLCVEPHFVQDEMREDTESQDQQPVLPAAEMEKKPCTDDQQQEYERVREEPAAERAIDQTSHRLVDYVREYGPCEQRSYVDSTAQGGDPRFDKARAGRCLVWGFSPLRCLIVQVTAEEAIQDHSRAEGNSGMSKEQHCAK